MSRLATRPPSVYARAELSWKPASDRQRMADEEIGVAQELWLGGDEVKDARSSVAT
ncbi:hypothetical protein [Bradyrhizobium sp. 170]|uniref:hypothetical protein n=1 Tax=Bradyrhizobium sp. 170 TaxID=2782641 RepID=UPI001FFE50ED|nr:hypothetical protein [Bradyrhizobium sp. 170]UPK02381.1 hypothetical protein IVB05_33050 [Bradyrhizobium sp. 170]